MNIHFFHSDPVINARYLDDIRLRKMITENMQMIATTFHVLNLPEYIPLNKQLKPYRSSHVNHPSTVWVRKSKANLLWLCDYTEAMYARYKRSGGQAFTNIPDNLKKAREGALKLPDVGLTKFANCARHKDLGIDYTWMEDAHIAYQSYMADRWEMDTIKLTWTGVDE